ncbi:MAG: tyrosine-type recombinase/integrase [Candidatus Merdivicinus sp.]
MESEVGGKMQAEYCFKREVEHILAALMPANRLACEVSLATGLRIGDVLRLKTEDVFKERFSVQESKTGKRRVVRLTKDLKVRCAAFSGSLYVFPGRLDGRKPRSRQAVWKDLKRVARLMRLDVNLTPHSMRKVYAVEQYHKDGDLKRVQRLLNHSSEAVTMIYAMADEQVRRAHNGRK